jgi:hypothetical protein
MSVLHQTKQMWLQFTLSLHHLVVYLGCQLRDDEARRHTIVQVLQRITVRSRSDHMA